MRKYPVWLKLMGVAVVLPIVCVVVSFTVYRPGEDFAILEDEGGGFVETFEQRGGPSFLAVSLLPSSEVNVSPVGGKRKFLDFEPVQAQVIVRGEIALIPLEGPTPTFILVDESGNVLTDVCPVFMDEVYGMLADARGVAAFSSDGRKEKLGSSWAIALPAAQGSTSSIIAVFVRQLQIARRPWPEAILNGMAGYVARMDEQQKVSDASAAGRP